MEYHGVCVARSHVWDWIRSYTKPGTECNPVKPLRGCPICELPESSQILQQLLRYYTWRVRHRQALRGGGCKTQRT